MMQTATQVAEGLTATTGQVITAATPTAQSTVETVLAQEPTILAAGAGGLVVLYLLAPRLGSAIAYSARGFAGKELLINERELLCAVVASTLRELSLRELRSPVHTTLCHVL